VSDPDVIGSDDGGRRRRGLTVVVVLGAVAVGAGLIVNSVSGKRSHGAAMPSNQATASPSAPSASALTPDVPDVVVRIGDGLDEVSGDQLFAIGDLPTGATDVWATTLSVDQAPNDSGTVHIFGLHDGRAFRQDIRRFSTAVTKEDLGAASAVLQTQEYPVLVHDGDPVTVGAPGSRIPLPAGWKPARFENLGYAGLLIKPADAQGNVEIASWSPDGTPQPLTTSGRLLGVTDGGQAMWLDPTCPSGPQCALFFGDVGGLHPDYGIYAPAGTQYTTDAAAFGPGGYLAAVAARTSGAGPTLVLVEPWQDTAVIMPGSEGVEPAAGMFWVDGKRLVFVADQGQGPRLMLYDVDANVSRPFGPALPDGVRLLTAFGSAGGVTVLP
jgi:hypothetical protein